MTSDALSVQACFVSLSFAGLVVLARSLNPIPSRTRPLNSSAPMVLWLKPWESRSLPDLPRTKQFLFTCHDQTERRLPPGRRRFCFATGNVPVAIAAPARTSPLLCSKLNSSLDRLGAHAFSALGVTRKRM